MNSKTLRWRGWLTALGVFAVIAVLPLAAACGDDDDDDDDGGNGGGQAAATIGDLKLFDPWVRTTQNDVSAGYVRIENSGEADTLVKATANITQMVQLHEVVTEGSSSKMQQKEGGFPVPAHGTVELKPGGFHIMLMNLTEPLDAGDSVELELTFEKAGTVKLTAPVQQGPGMDGMSPDMHN